MLLEYADERGALRPSRAGKAGPSGALPKAGVVTVNKRASHAEALAAIGGRLAGQRGQSHAWDRCPGHSTRNEFPHRITLVHPQTSA
jgi:hypothetical protein